MSERSSEEENTYMILTLVYLADEEGKEHTEKATEG
jgi:hypothetical protein